MNLKTLQSRDHKDWFRYWKDPLKITIPLVFTKVYRERNLDRKNWKTHLSTDDLCRQKGLLSGLNTGIISLSEEKESIRARVVQQRSELSSRDVEEKSHRIYLNLIGLDIFKFSDKIGLYSPIKNEVRTDSIFLKAKELGKEVYFPKVSGSSLSFHRVGDLNELAPGKFGVLEPAGRAPIVEPRELDLLVVPGAAFDARGGRLGYGKGYYDRFMVDVPRSKRIGISYKLQLQKSIPSESHDLDLGLLVHELGIIFCRSNTGGI